MIDRDEIIKLAREAGFITGVTHASSGYSHPFVHPATFPTCLAELERFAALVAAAEREACANEADRQAAAEPYGHAKFRCANIAAAIRARSGA